MKSPAATLTTSLVDMVLAESTARPAGRNQTGLIGAAGLGERVSSIDWPRRPSAADCRL
jgi:hypothetical protein